VKTLLLSSYLQALFVLAAFLISTCLSLLKSHIRLTLQLSEGGEGVARMLLCSLLAETFVPWIFTS
jgi:hypothetical protein